MGKYTNVAMALKIAEPEDALYQRRVENTRLTPVKILYEKFLDLFKPFSVFKKLVLDRSMDEMSDEALAKAFAMHKGIKAQLELVDSYNNLMIIALDQELLARLARGKQDSVRFTKLGLFTRKDSIYVKIVDDTAFDAWCYACKTCDQPPGACLKKPKHVYEGRVDYRVRNTNKVAGDVRSMLVDGEEPPPGIEVRSRQSIQFTREK